jgi:hypothetical protein
VGKGVSGDGKWGKEGNMESSFSLSSLCSPCLCGEIFWEKGICGLGRVIGLESHIWMTVVCNLPVSLIKERDPTYCASIFLFTKWSKRGILLW